MSTVKNAVWAASASAITALGLLACPSVAHAEPGCTQYGYTGGIVIKEDSGWQIAIPFRGQAAGGGTVTAVDERGRSKQGNASGSISGRSVNVTTTYNDGSQRYVGDIGNDGIGRGITQNPVAGASGIGWHTEFAFDCLAPAAPVEAPKPSPQPILTTTSAPAPAPQATVNGDVDVYDVPGGGGNVTGTLNEGQRVLLVGCKPDNWCEIRGVGWVWGDFIDRP